MRDRNNITEFFFLNIVCRQSLRVQNGLKTRSSVEFTRNWKWKANQTVASVAEIVDYK
jgi:hypothetical protein